jgi:hypothetical protein
LLLGLYEKEFVQGLQDPLPRINLTGLKGGSQQIEIELAEGKV